MFASTAKKSHHPQYSERVAIYKCYNRTQHKELCDGPTTYRAEKVDAVISELIRNILQKAKSIRLYDLIHQQATASTFDLQQQLQQMKSDLSKRTSELKKWESMMLDSIEGTCIFSPQQIKNRMDSIQTEIDALLNNQEALEHQLQGFNGVTKELQEQHEQLVSWADLFEIASPAERKLIASQLIKAVTLKRNYQIQVEFNISEAQYLNGMQLE